METSSLPASKVGGNNQYIDDQRCQACSHETSMRTF